MLERIKEWYRDHWELQAVYMYDDLGNHEVVAQVRGRLAAESWVRRLDLRLPYEIRRNWHVFTAKDPLR